MKRLFYVTLLAIAIPAGAIAGLGLTRAGLETPKYKVVERKSGFEIRNYPTLPVVSTKMSAAASRQQQDARFMRLFRYIDKGNSASQKISMTTPVFMESGGSSGAMSFFIPDEVSEAGAPKPKEGAVYLNEIRGGKYAVMRFRGGRSGSAERRAVEALTKAIEAAGIKKADGDPLFAYYDPPWTPKMLRRNEVLMRLK